jgi:hypothetical protein
MGQQRLDVVVNDVVVGKGFRTARGTRPVREFRGRE